MDACSWAKKSLKLALMCMDSNFIKSLSLKICNSDNCKRLVNNLHIHVKTSQEFNSNVYGKRLVK